MRKLMRFWARMATLVGQHGRSPQHDFGHMHIRDGVDTITRWDGNPSWNSGRMQLGDQRFS